MKKPKRKPKKYRITMRVDVSYSVELERYAGNILAAGRNAMNMARADALQSLPYAADLNSVEVIIEDGEKVEDNT